MPHARSVAAVGVEDPVAAGIQSAKDVRTGGIGARMHASERRRIEAPGRHSGPFEDGPADGIRDRAM